MGIGLFEKREIIVFLLLIIGFILFIFNGKIGIYGLLFFFVLIFMFYIIDRVFLINFTMTHYLYLVFVGFGGVLFGYLQSEVMYLDKFFHFFSAMMLTSVTYYFSKKMKFRNPLVVSILLSLFVIFAYEFYEYVLDLFFLTSYRGSYNVVDGKIVEVLSGSVDTFLDMVIGGIGVLCYVILRLLKKESKII
jgi:hypothetical protein